MSQDNRDQVGRALVTDRILDQAAIALVQATKVEQFCGKCGEPLSVRLKPQFEQTYG